MKFILYTLLALACFVGKAQNLGTAVFKDCVNLPDPELCTEQKFENGINSLMTYDISNQIKKKLNKNYFSVSIIFVIDKEGKIIPETKEIHCDYPDFKLSIEKYLNNLTPLQPKESSHEGKGTLHALHYTFMLNNIIDKYESVDNIRLKVEGIHPKYYFSETVPLFPECKCKKSDVEKNANKCTTKKLIKFIEKNFKTPPSGGNPRSVKIITSFIVEKDGSITISKIDSPEEDLNIEMERVMKLLPKFKPATLKGFLLRARYTFPTTINFYE